MDVLCTPRKESPVENASVVKPLRSKDRRIIAKVEEAEQASAWSENFKKKNTALLISQLQIKFLINVKMYISKNRSP